MMTSSDVIVVGSGLIGTSIAYRLAHAGYSVTVLDQAAPGAGASGSCDQAIFLQSKKPGVHMELALSSRSLFDTLEDELDADLEFKADGGMVAIENEQQWAFMESFVARQREAGIRIDLLDRAEARQAQPLLADSIAGATFSPMDAEISPLLLNAAYATAAERMGVKLIRNAEVHQVIDDGTAVCGVVTATSSYSADVVINAAGPHAGRLARLAGVNTPIVPRRGAILITAPAPRQIRGVLLSAQYVAAKHLALRDEVPFGVGLSLGQTAAGNLLIGGSREFVGFSTRVPEAVMQAIARHALAIVPSLGNHRVIRMMRGFRPFTGDGLPIIEVSRPGWVTAAGHEGDGIALAPLTGQLVLDLLRGSGPAHHFLESLSSLRPSLSTQSQPHQQIATGDAR
ncbi:NAD(P)/FAD-dependent oxidoreductase [Brevibacterium luteolum]|uniref:NAD(P)/FAD-dependent oxidoreductase n=1 Tax=Brevibacterium luteolum TaxID=199591 RepID=UPI003B680D75